MSKLQGKVALVTGASKGIGASIALELAAQGASVAVNYSGSKAGADKVVADIKKAGGKALAGELGPRKIRVNSLNPGMIETEGVHAAGFIGSDFQKKIESETPLGRIGQPGAIAHIP